MQDTEEIWKDIPGFTGYKISTHGNVKSLSGNLLKPGISIGYKQVVLRDDAGNWKSKRIHQLVAITFKSHIPCGHKWVVHHKDEDTLNNHIDNLDIVTNRTNITISKKNKSSKYPGVSWYTPRKKWRAIIYMNGKYKELGHFTNEIDASNAYQNALKNIV